LRSRDLVTVAAYRDRLKSDYITEVLMASITTKHTIRPSLGVAEFIELQFKNPFPSEQTITIECHHPELRVVTDGREWKYLKAVNGVQTPVEDDMFDFDPVTSRPQVLLRAKETIFIPFRYQGYETDQFVPPQGPGQVFKHSATSLQPKDNNSSHGSILSKVVTATIRSKEGRPLSVLHLTVDPQQHVVDQTFRFYHPEQTFLKKCIRLPPFKPKQSSISNGEGQLHVVCSDSQVVCQTRSVSNDEPREIFIKCPCGQSPTIRRFFLAIYDDAFLATPVQIWKFYVHALQCVDVNCVLGETCRFTLALRGTQTARMVKTYSSHPLEMQVAPTEQFLLPPNGVLEMNAAVRTLSISKTTKYMVINVVDNEYHQLIRNWLVAVKTRLPTISKEFDISIPRSGGKGCNKIISFTNPYSNNRIFYLITNRSDLLQFRENRLELEGGGKTTIGLRFVSGISLMGKHPIHIFINDEEDKNEETFLVNVNYV